MLNTLNVLDYSIITHRSGASTYVCVLGSSKQDNGAYVLCCYADITHTATQG